MYINVKEEWVELFQSLTGPQEGLQLLSSGLRAYKALTD